MLRKFAAAVGVDVKELLQSLKAGSARTIIEAL
jgi:hypothetical protein